MSNRQQMGHRYYYWDNKILVEQCMYNSQREYFVYGRDEVLLSFFSFLINI